MINPQERRRYPRYALDLPVILVLTSDSETSYSGEMRDLSAGGCFFRAVLPHTNFANVSLSFKRQLRAPTVAGHVVRRVSSEGFAVSFDDAGGELQRLVSALGALTPTLRGEFVGGFLDPAVELG